MVNLLAAFGLSAATGLNAYLPLLIVGLLARFTDVIVLKSHFRSRSFVDLDQRVPCQPSQ